MRKYKKPRFLKVEDFSDPRRLRIAAVVEGKYDRADLVFETGDRLGLSATNTETLANAYGWDSESWTGHLVEFYVDRNPFKQEGDDQPEMMIFARPLSKAEGVEDQKQEPVRKTPDVPPDIKSKASFGSSDGRAGGANMDDEIPF